MGAVLIVDDSAADRALLRTILGRAGYTVYEVAKGGDAVQKAREVRPHIIILDVNLPDMNGLAVCRAIRADREIASVPVLMLTVRDDDTDVLAGLEAGADDYVAKDSAGAIVLGRVRRLIQFRQMSSMAMLNQQLVQVGRLLAGIVHEIRGPLAVIRGSAELLLYTEAPTAKTINGSMRSSAIRSCFSSGSTIWWRPCATARRTAENIELPPLLRESVQLFLKGLPPGDRKIEVEIACDEQVPRGSDRSRPADAGLVQPARQCPAGPGAARTEPAVSCCVPARPKTQGRRWVVVDIVDNGPGVPEAFIDRIFEPFFTTRDDGTGYGLYLAAELLKEQSGRLTVGNNREGGATFTIWLPETDSVAEADAGLRGSEP